MRADRQHMLEVLEEALDDLETWHSEAFAYTHPTQGHIMYGSCDGCVTCQKTIPSLQLEINRLIDEVDDSIGVDLENITKHG